MVQTENKRGDRGEKQGLNDKGGGGGKKTAVDFFGEKKAGGKINEWVLGSGGYEGWNGGFTV